MNRKPRSVAVAPERLRQALLVEGMTARDLAAKVNVSEETIGRYLRGDGSPQATTLQLIAEALNRPAAFFWSPAHTLDGSPVFWRSFAAATKTARRRAATYYSFFREVSEYVQRFVQIPAPNFPAPVAADPLTLSNEEIEEAAAAVRRFWGLGDGPIANVVRLFEHHGAAVGRTNLGAATLDAFSQWAHPEERPYFVLGADKPSAVRARWNAAHELGHMILHRELPKAVIADPEIHSEIERQANYFAGAFLLPAETFSRSVFVPTLNGLMIQKNVWKASIGAMIMRLTALDLISEEQQRRLWQSYSRNGFRRKEPGDDTMEIEEPQVLKRALGVLLAERTPEQILTDLALREDDIQGLLNLPLGAWRDKGPDVRLRERQTGEARVLPMRFRNN